MRLSSGVAITTALTSFASAKLVPRASTTATGFDTPESWLSIIPDSSLGEPLNVVISNQSSAAVLTEEGLANFLSSLFFSPNDCLGISEGTVQQANLNDGRGDVNQTDVYRYNYDEGITTCVESVEGGQHFRTYNQTSTGAIFIAASVEGSASTSHDIVADGYDLGRNWLVGNATNSSGTTSPQTGATYSSTMTSLTVDIDAADINHGISIDDEVYVLTVTQKSSGDGSNPTSTGASTATSTSGSSSSSSPAAPRAGLLIPTIAVLCCLSLPLFL